MIKIEHTVLPSPEQMEFVIEGMRNPLNSWDKSDSDIARVCAEGGELILANSINNFSLGDADHNLMQRLAKAGTEHRKYMRMMPVYVRITAPLYFLKEFDTYKIGTVSNSCSTMHKIQEKEFTLDDFSHEHLKYGSLDTLKETVRQLNLFRTIYLNGGTLGDIFVGAKETFKPKDKEIWWQMIQLLPSSYNQTRNVMLNYEVLCDIYKQRKNHKLDEWRDFCSWIENLPYSELIIASVENK